MDGRGRVVIEIGRRMLQRGDDVHVAAASGSVDAMRGFHFHRVPIPAGIPWSLRTLFFALASALVVSRLRARVDVVHAHGPTFARVDVTTCHGLHRAAIDVAAQVPDIERMGLRPADLSRPRLLLPVLEASMRRGRVVALTRRMKRELRELVGIPADRIDVIPNGVDGSRFAPHLRKGLRPGARRDFQLADTPTALFVGHDFKRKGLVRAIQALAHLDSAVLLVLGADPNDLRIQSFVECHAEHANLSGRVRFLGSREDVERAYAAADLLLAPSLYEGFCLAVLEALASGLPVVGTPPALPAELGDAGDALRRVGAQASSEELASALRRTFGCSADAIERHALAVSARFSWSKIAELTRAVYEG